MTGTDTATESDRGFRVFLIVAAATLVIVIAGIAGFAWYQSQQEQQRSDCRVAKMTASLGGDPAPDC